MMLAGINHLREAARGNLAPYNLGIMAPDFLVPLTLAWLLYRMFILSAESRAAAMDRNQPDDRR